MKIGQKIIIDNELKNKAHENNRAIDCDINDEAYIDHVGIMHYVTGKAKGKIQKLDLKESLNSYDYINIAHILCNALREHPAIGIALENGDIDPGVIKKVLFNSLFDIL